MNERPFGLRGLDHVVLRVADEKRALDFYCNVLGCREERRLAQFGLIQLRAGASLIDLVVTDPPAGRDDAHRNMDHFALQIADFDVGRLQAYLRERGIDPGEPADRYGAEGSGISIYVKDPDGNTVELKGPARPGTRLSPPS